MSNFQFAMILEGVKSQGNFINTIVYSSGDFGQDSCDVLLSLIPYLNDLSLTNIKRGQHKLLFQQILDACLNHGHLLQKIKLSNLNLNDNKIVDMICQIIQCKEFVTHLDFSWSCLSASHLNKIAMELVKNPHFIRNLNLSYNSLTYDEKHADFAASEQFVENMCEYLEQAWILNHLDLSGLNL